MREVIRNFLYLWCRIFRGAPEGTILTRARCNREVGGRRVCLVTARGDTPALCQQQQQRQVVQLLTPCNSHLSGDSSVSLCKFCFHGITSHTTRWSGCLLFCSRLPWLSAPEQQRRCKASCTTASSSWYASDITRSQEVTEVFRHCFATCLCPCTAAPHAAEATVMTQTAFRAQSAATSHCCDAYKSLEAGTNVRWYMLGVVLSVSSKMSEA